MGGKLQKKASFLNSFHQVFFLQNVKKFFGILPDERIEEAGNQDNPQVGIHLMQKSDFDFDSNSALLSYPPSSWLWLPFV